MSDAYSAFSSPDPYASFSSPAASGPRSVVDKLLNGGKTFIPHLVQAWHDATVTAPDALVDIATDPQARAKAALALKQQFQDAKDTVGGYVQQVRDLSSPDSRGSAPSASPQQVAKALQMERDVTQKFGVNPTPQRISKALSGDVGQPNTNAASTLLNTWDHHPLSVAALAAPLTGKAIGAAGDLAGAAGDLAGATGLSDAVAPAGQKMAEMLGNAPAAAANVLDAGATPAAQQVVAPVRQRLAELLAQTDEVTSQAEAAKAADVPLRGAMEGAAAGQAAKGIGVSDLPEAKSLVADLQARLKPQGSVVTIPTTGQATAYQKIIDTLSPSAQGQKPSLEMVQNLRRELEAPAYAGQDPSGFAAVSKLDKRNLGKQLAAIEDAYTGGASVPVRENWRNYSVLQDQADAMAKTKDMFTTQAAQLDELPPVAAARKAQTIATGLAKKGLISDSDYRDLMQLSNAATDARGKSLFRKRVAMAIGGGAVGYEATKLGGHALGILP